MGGPADRGAALIDVVFAVGVVAVLSGIAIPTMQSAREYRAARSGARYLAARLQQARMESLKRNVVVAVRFDPGDESRFAVYGDGDGDGVLQSDIDHGVDRLITPAARLTDYLGPITLRINQDVPEPETGAPLTAGGDPLRIGRSPLLSFSPLGTATSGTLYLAGPAGPQMAIRILGATGRMRVLRFDTAARQWRDD
jgi:type II secretory pathway pseudopilin PulG